MLAALEQKNTPLVSVSDAGKATHILVVLPARTEPPDELDFFWKRFAEHLVVAAQNEGGRNQRDAGFSQSGEWRVMRMGEARSGQIRVRAASIDA